MSFKRLEGENEEQFIWRIGQAKDSGLLDLSWTEIADIINKEFRETDEEYRAESAYRKPYSQAKRFFEQGVFSQYNTDHSYADELIDKKRDLEKERQKLFSEKIEYSRQIRQQSRFELLYENIAKAITSLPVPKFERVNITYGNREYVAVFGDIHYGADFKSENNNYSRTECKRRFEKMLAAYKEFVEMHAVTKMKILNLGDNIQGILRISDLQMNDTDVVRCVVEVSQLIAGFLNELSAVCDIEYYHVTQSNHTQTRNLGTKASELAGEDLEKIIANYIHDVLANNPAVEVIFDMDKEYIDFDIFDFHCTAEHGHRISNVNNYLKDKSNLRRKMYSYGFLGHFHAGQEIIVGEENSNNVEVLIAPAFVGSDPYADKLNVGAKAMTKIYTFDKQFGRIASENIILN